MDEKIDKIQKSIDDLTAAVAQGFSRFEERFEQVEGKIDTLATKEEVGAGFEGVNGKIDGLHRRIDAELERTLQLETRVVKIEEVVGIAK